MRTIKGYCLLRAIEKEHITSSGIILGTHEQQSKLVRDVYPDHGIVTSINTSDLDTCGFKVGDEVIFHRWGSQPVEDLLRTPIKDILVVTEGVQQHAI